MCTESNDRQAKELNESIREIERSQYAESLFNSGGYFGSSNYRIEYDALSNKVIISSASISNSIEEAIEDIENGKIEASEVKKRFFEILYKLDMLRDFAMYGVGRV